jgi:hypothetical protein
VGVDGGETILDGAGLARDAVVLALEHGYVDGAGVVRVQQLATLAFELGQLASLELALCGVAALAGHDLGLHVNDELSTTASGSWSRW